MKPGRLAGFGSDSARFHSLVNATAGNPDFPAVSFTTEWREGAPEGRPPQTAWRSFPTPRFERGERPPGPRACHAVTETAVERWMRLDSGRLSR